MTLVGKWLDNGQLYAKYFLIDSSLNARKWRTTDAANELYAKTAIGTPLTVMENRAEAKYNDYHPFIRQSEGEPVDVEREINHAYKYAVGQIVDVTKESGRYKAAYGGPDGVIDNPWFAIVKVTDPSRLPERVSAGIIQLEGPDEAISEYRIAHLAGVPEGAYGPRAIRWASCNGDALTCLPQLKAASAPVPAPVSFSSLQKTDDTVQHNKMSVQPVSTPAPQHFGSGTVSTTTPAQSQSQATQAQSQMPVRPIVKVRPRRLLAEEQPNGEEEQNNNNNNNNNNRPEGEEPLDEGAQADAMFRKSSFYKKFQDMEQKYKTQSEQMAYKDKRHELEKIIPASLFKDQKGRFRQKDWEAEVENAIKENVPLSFLERYYALQRQMSDLPELEVPASKTRRASAPSSCNGGPSAPTITKGASSYDSMDAEDIERKVKLAELAKMIRGVSY